MRVALCLGVAGALALRAVPTEGSDAPARGLESTEGRLVTQRGEHIIDVPLAHTDVAIRIDGHMADATVTQEFHNPYKDKIEAVYLFPLPAGAAVNDMEIATAGRHIRGQIHRREQARRIYRRARARGQVAALLTQQRPNLFTQAVANIEPGATVSVTIRYAQALDYERGGYELVFPMVAGPRHLPAAGGEAREPAADEDSVQPAVLPPGARSAHEISLRVEIDAGVAIQQIRSPSHRIDVQRSAEPARATVAIAAGDTIPNKDFVLRYQVAGRAPAFGVLTHRETGPGSFFLIAQPPELSGAVPVAAREIVFVLDTSSSMAGAPLEKAKQVIRQVLGGMRPDDTYQIVRFDDGASALGPHPIANKARNLEYTFEWLDRLQAAGGTAMTAGISSALSISHDPARLRIAVFLTDGYIGNEDEILADVRARMGEARLFSFGVGTAVNRYLLEEMAVLGRGDVQVVRPDEDTEQAVERFYRRIDAPLLTDLHVDWGGLSVSDLEPSRLPDLFAGQPLVLSGHYVRPGTATVTVRGRRGGRLVQFQLPVELPEHADRPAVAAVWARRRIAELSRQLLRESSAEIERSIVELALAHRLMTRYTAFVAVDEAAATAGAKARRVAVPVEVPEGVRSIVASGTGAGYGSIGLGNFSTVGHGSGGGGGGAFGKASRGFEGGGRPALEDAAAPLASVRSLDMTTGGASVDTAVIRRYVRRKYAGIRHCYEQQLAAHPALAGRIEVRFAISASGKVIASSVDGLDNPALERCVADVISSIQFPPSPSAGVINVTYPFMLGSADAGDRRSQP